MISKDDLKKLGNESYAAGDFEKALEHYTEAIKLDSGFIAARMNRAYTFEELNELEKAAADYKKITEINTDEEEAFFRLGLLYDELGLFREALKSYTEVLRINPSNDHALFNQSMVLEELGDYRKAHLSMKKFLALSNSDAEAKNRLRHLDHLTALPREQVPVTLFEQGIEFLKIDKPLKAGTSFQTARQIKVKEAGKHSEQLVPYLSALLEMDVFNRNDQAALKIAREMKQLSHPSTPYYAFLCGRADMLGSTLDLLARVEADPSGQEAVTNEPVFNVCISALKGYGTVQPLLTPFDHLQDFRKEILFILASRFNLCLPKPPANHASSGGTSSPAINRRFKKQNKIFINSPGKTVQPVPSTQCFVHDLTTEPGSCSTEIFLHPGIWSWEPLYPELDGYGYIVLRDINKTEVIADGKAVKIHGSFRGFKEVPAGVHEIIVDTYSGYKTGVRIEVPDGGCTVLIFDPHTDTLVPDRMYGFDYISKAIRHVMDSYLFDWP